jgi:negative regulator of sigma E activity
MIAGMFNDPERDPRLADALRGSPMPGGSLDDEQLHSRIMSAARPRLAQLRAWPRPWWEWTAGWARVAVPVGLAASLVAGVLLVRSPSSGESLSSVAADTTTASGVILSAAAGGTGSPQVGDELVAQASDDWLLTQVMSQ